MSLWSSSANIKSSGQQVGYSKEDCKISSDVAQGTFQIFHVFKCDLYSPTFLFMPLYHYFMCNKFEHLTYILYNSLGKCSLGNGNAAPLGFTTLYIRASPPQDCKLLSRRILAALYSPWFEASIVVQAWKEKWRGSHATANHSQKKINH